MGDDYCSGCGGSFYVSSSCRCKKGAGKNQMTTEEKLAVAVEALREAQDKLEARHWPTQRKIINVLSSITSDAPAKADTVDNGPAARLSQSDAGSHDPGFDSAAGPASKPLVVGQKYRIEALPLWAEAMHVGALQRFTVINKVMDRVHCRFSDGVTTFSDADAIVTLLKLPSAKADEGKAQTCSPEEIEAAMRKGAETVEMLRAARALNPTAATPPALTREEVASMIDKAFRQLWLNMEGDHLTMKQGEEYDTARHVCAAPLGKAVRDIVRAALSDGGEE